MTPSRPIWWLGVLVLFSLFAGEALRDTLSWWGFAAWDGVALITLAIVFLINRRSPDAATPFRRVALRSAPLPVLLIAGFAAWATLSLVWSAYRPQTVLAIVVLAATTFGGLALRALLGWRGLATALATALQAILGLSLLFELGVALILRRPVLPVFPIDVEPGRPVPDAFYWSRALLLEGGRIQGIVGNANLLGFVALLALVVTGCLVAARVVRAIPGAAGIVLAALMLALTRSSAVIVAAVACGIVLALILLWRADSRRRAPFWIGLGALAVLAAAGVAARGVLLGVLGKSDDLTGRVDIWTAVGGLVAQRPVLGWGWISYWIPGVAPYDGLAVRKGVEYLQAHDAYLDALVQLGPVGLALLLAAITATAMGIARTPGQPVLVRVLPALLLTALVTQALVESRLLVEGNWALLCALAATATGRRSPAGPSPADEVSSRSSRPPARPARR